MTPHMAHLGVDGHIVVEGGHHVCEVVEPILLEHVVHHLNENIELNPQDKTSTGKLYVSLMKTGKELSENLFLTF